MADGLRDAHGSDCKSTDNAIGLTQCVVGSRALELELQFPSMTLVRSE